MAGGNFFNKNPKGNKYSPVFNNTETLKDSHTSPNKAPDFLSGILNPGESITFKKEQNQPEKPKFTDYLGKEQSLFVNEHQNEVEKTINDLRLEIKKLIQVSENISDEIKQSVDQNIAEISEYQLNFFQRIKVLVIGFRQQISEASVWMETFNHKKKKCNAFRNKAKTGGQQYQDSSEHAVARSAN